MLLTISVSNFILIDSLEIDLNTGLTVLTGETGAGKSIILDALLCALGDRSSNKLIKDKDKAANISLTFDIKDIPQLRSYLAEQGIGDSKEVILRRSVSPDGKSKAYVNDVPCTVSQLQFFREHLVEICGQHDSRGLLDNAQHLKLLDQFAGVDTSEIKLLYQEWRALEVELSSLKEKIERSEIEKSFLKNIISELKELNIKPGEEESLAEQRKVMSEGSKIKDCTELTESLIKNDALPIIYKLQKELSRFQEYFKEPLGMVNNACIELDEAANSIYSLSSRFNGDYTSLESLENRLFKIRSMARKYNVLSEDFPQMLEQKEQDLHLIENSSEAIAELEKRLKVMMEKYLKKAKEISQIRAKEILKLQDAILQHFADLKLEKAEFKVEHIVSENSSDYAASGIDKIKFLIKTNPGMPFDQLSKIASGGELSRFLLAIKVACVNVKTVPVMVFDEIDTGVSGAVSSSIGRKLAQLSKNSQVIVVTHQPQVAAFASNHLVVSKKVQNNRTSVYVSSLDVPGKEQELARLLSGEVISNESIAAAKKLIQAAA